MKAYCPRCGQTYPSGLTFCKQDGTALIHKRRRWPYWVVAVLAILVTAVLLLLAVIPNYLARNVRAEVGHVSLQVQSFQPFVQLGVHVTNSSLIPIKLHSISSNCVIDGAEVATAYWEAPENGATEIASNGNAEISIKMKFNVVGLKDAVGGMSRHGQVSCSGPAVVSFLGLKRTQRIDYKADVW